MCSIGEFASRDFTVPTFSSDMIHMLELCWKFGAADQFFWCHISNISE